MADRWGWQHSGRSTSPYSVFFLSEDADTVHLGERSLYGCDFLFSSLSFFLFFSPAFTALRRGYPPAPPSSSPTCLLASALVWGKGSCVIICEWVCSGNVNLPCSGLVAQLWPQLWCSLSAEPALCLKCLGNYNMHDACVYPHHT